MRLLAEALGVIILSGLLIYGAKQAINKFFPSKQDPSNPDQE